MQLLQNSVDEIIDKYLISDSFIKKSHQQWKGINCGAAALFYMKLATRLVLPAVATPTRLERCSATPPAAQAVVCHVLHACCGLPPPASRVGLFHLRATSAIMLKRTACESKPSRSRFCRWRWATIWPCAMTRNGPLHKMGAAQELDMRATRLLPGHSEYGLGHKIGR